MKINENQRKPIEINGNQRKSRKIKRIQQKSQEIIKIPKIFQSNNIKKLTQIRNIRYKLRPATNGQN